jgi:SAM-dependent methyltransferase
MHQPDFRPSSDRNKDPILDVLRQILPVEGSALEIASGTGQHVEWFALHLPRWQWQPTDADSDALAVTDARLARSGLGNVHRAALLDVLSGRWFGDVARAPLYDLIFCCNMLHIAPWEACAALMRGAARHLAPTGRLVTYGPYFEEGLPAVQSNLDFDRDLRAADPRRGVRQLSAVQREARAVGLVLQTRYAMPSNNLLLVWTFSPAP